jgi:acyl-CoA thioesterase-1
VSRRPLGGKPLWLRLFVLSAALLLCGSGVFLVHSQLTHNSSSRAVAKAVGGHETNGDARAYGSAVINSHSGATPAERDVLFIGASYTAGLGATPPTEGYAYVVGREPGWRTQVYGVAGTGFLNPGPHGGQTFAQRVAHVPDHIHPDLVVFQGGRNDVAYPAAKLRAAAIATAELTRKRFAGAQIVFLGPIPAHVPAPPSQLAVASTLRSAATACHAVFLDPIEQSWITPENEKGFGGPVPAHPDNSGYAYIAQRLMGDLDRLFPTGGTA